MAHEQTFGADIFKEHHELQLEKHNGINGGTTPMCIGLLHELTHKRQIKRSLEMAIEMIGWNQLF
jgi:hypothetical protein